MPHEALHYQSLMLTVCLPSQHKGNVCGRNAGLITKPFVARQFYPVQVSKDWLICNKVGCSA